MKKKPQIYMISVVSVTLIAATAILWFLNPLNGFGANQIFPISLRSSFFADYSQDPNRLSENPQEPLNFFEQIIRGIQELIDPDKIVLNAQTTEQNIINPETTMTLVNTNTPIQTTPAIPGATATTGNNSTPTKISSSVPTITRTPTPTLTSTLATFTITPTGIFTGTSNPTIGVTRTHTPTSIQPTNTFSPGITSTQTPTPINVPPTWTSIPITPTKTPIPTGYPAPPTVTVPGYP